jgi:hypothetical protein
MDDQKILRRRVSTKKGVGGYNMIDNQTPSTKQIPGNTKSTCAQIYANVMLSILVVMILTAALVFGIGGIKTKPTAMDLMGRFIGISETVNMGRDLLEGDDLKHVMDTALNVYNKVQTMIPVETVEKLVHKTTFIINSISEEEMMEIKNNVVKFSRVLGSINKDQIQNIINQVDHLNIDKINELVQDTDEIEKRLRDSHEIKIGF